MTGACRGGEEWVAVFEGLRGRSVWIETYGCPYNHGDSAKLVEILKHHGAMIAGSAGEAEAVILNTCTVVGPTERRMLRRLAALRDRELYVTGCMAVIQPEAIKAVCTPILILPDVIHELYRDIGTVAQCSVGIVQIAKGCTGRCTYCITRRARGPLESFPRKGILAQVRSLVGAGACEIRLTAQDVSAWGCDIGESFPGLLEEAAQIPGRYRIRVGMMNPATVRDQAAEVAEAFRSGHIFSFLHLPVQSGSDAILERMGRQYTVAEFEDVIRIFRSRVPHLTVATDMIVGFPGESVEDFSASVSLIRRIKPSKVNVTRYSQRPFTIPVPERGFPESVVKERSRAMNACAEEVYSRINAGRIGETVPFMVTEILRRGSVMARSPDYTGILLHEDLPSGFAGQAVLTRDRKYFFTGTRVITGTGVLAGPAFFEE